MKKLSNSNLIAKPVDSLYFRITDHIDAARTSVQRIVDTEMLKAYWKIGRDIVEAELKGASRAQ